MNRKTVTYQHISQNNSMKLTKLFLIFLCLPFITHAQNNGVEHIDSLAGYFLKYVKSLDKEKILLQTDRQIYATRETIYFKLFPIDSITKRLTATSKKLYVDLVNNKDEVFAQLLLNASNLKTSGEFVLDDSLKQGYYWIRAYTEKMISENLNEITVVPVYIINARTKNFDQISAKKESVGSAAIPVVQIFPEGGNIISGINTTVAVKVTDQHGTPVVIRGMVKDNTDSVYARFNTDSNGLSKFSLNPIWYHSYSVFVWNKNKYDSVAALPPINFYGAQIAVLEQTEDHVKVRIALEDSIYSKDYTTYLLATNGDSISYSAIGKGMYEVEIPLNNFSHGINSLLLFNSKNQLLSERDIFIKNENYHIDIDSDKDNYAARENANVDLTVTDKNGKPLLAALAVAITDTRVNDSLTNNCMNNTLQSFSAKDADLVMLTQKIKYANLRATDSLKRLKPISTFQRMRAKISPEERNNDSSFTISGTVVNSNKEPVAKKIITIFSKQNKSHFDTDTTDINGRFKFYFTDLNDSTQFVVQVSNLKGIKEDKYSVVFDTHPMPHFITPAYLKKKFIFDEKLKAIQYQLYVIDSFQIGTGKEWLKSLVVNSYKKPEVNYDKSKRVNPFSYIITPEMIGQGANMAGNALLRAPGVHSTGNSIAIGGVSVGREGPGRASYEEPLIVLNGVIVNLKESALDYINSIPVTSIDFIEVLSGPEAAIYGMEGGNGAILINTTSGAPKNETTVNGSSSFYSDGFFTTRPFMMPDYNNMETKASKIPDLRTTIYWDGNIITNKEGKVSINFFTADMPATYLITVTGISENGDKIYKTFTINRR